MIKSLIQMEMDKYDVVYTYGVTDRVFKRVLLKYAIALCLFWVMY